MIKQFQGLAILAILALSAISFAGDPPAYSISFNDKGGMISIAGTKTDSKVDALSVSINEPRFDTATGVKVNFNWRDGAQAADGTFRTARQFDCVKRTIGDKTVWVANVENMRDLIVDTNQQLSFWYEATMPGGNKLYTNIALGTVTNGIAAVHVDDALPFRLGVTFTRPDNTHQIEILAKPANKK